MHEHALLTALLRKIADLAAEHGAARVVRVRLRLGALCHLSEAHLCEHFARESQSTPAEGALLEVETDGDIHSPGAQEILLTELEIVEAASP